MSTGIETKPSNGFGTFNEAEFRRTLVFDVSNTVKSVQDDLRGLREFDHEIEQQSRTAILIGGAGIVVVVIALLCFFQASGSRSGGVVWQIAGVILGIGGLVGAAYGFINHMRKSKLNVENRRYELASGLLDLLGADMADDASVSAKIDFWPSNHRRKSAGKGKIGYWNVNFFVDRWLELSGRFVDGTKFSFAIIEKRQERHRKKRSMSGKIKHKYKTKSKTEAILQLRIKTKRYPQTSDTFRQIQKMVKLPSWVKLKSVEAQGDQLTLRTITTVPWDAVPATAERPKRDGIRWGAMMFLSLYGSLNQSKSK